MLEQGASWQRSLYFRHDSSDGAFVMDSKKQNDTLNTSLLAVTQTAVGCGLGLLLGGKMSRPAQKTTAFTLLGVGALLALPAIVDAVTNLISGPETERGARKSLDSIREGTGFPEEADVF